MNDLTKNIVLWVIIAVVLLAVFSNFGARSSAPQPMPYSQFLTEVKSNGIRTATFKGDSIVGARANGESYVTFNPETDNSALIGRLQRLDCGPITLRLFAGNNPPQEQIRYRPTLDTRLLVAVFDLTACVRGMSRTNILP